MFSMLPQATQPTNPFLLFGLTIVVLALIYPLIVICEVVVYQLRRWGTFRDCLKTAALVNAVSSAMGVVLMLVVPRPATWQLFIFLAMAIAIEAVLLNRIRPGQSKANWTLAIWANGVSYVVLILPAFRFQ
jgi:hypothetical protein